MANTDRTRSLIAAIVPTGIIAGLLDGAAAVIAHLLRGGRAPDRIFKYIASAALGPTATTGGWEMVAVGVLFHMTIAMGWTALFYLAATRVSALVRHAGAAILVACIGFPVALRARTYFASA